jgi:hypothetical protein
MKAQTAHRCGWAESDPLLRAEEQLQQENVALREEIDETRGGYLNQSSDPVDLNLLKRSQSCSN